MKINQENRNIISALLLGVYIFMTFYAVNLHNHGSSEVFKDFHFKKVEKSVTQSDFSQEFSDCLSCHIIHDGKNLLPQIFSISFFQESYFQKQVFAFEQRFSNVQHSVLQLRGPPIFI